MYPFSLVVTNIFNRKDLTIKLISKCTHNLKLCCITDDFLIVPDLLWFNLIIKYLSNTSLFKKIQFLLKDSNNWLEFILLCDRNNLPIDFIDNIKDVHFIAWYIPPECKNIVYQNYM